MTTPASHVVILTSARLHYSCLYAIDAPSKAWALHKARRLWRANAPDYAQHVGECIVRTRAEHDAADLLASIEANARKRETYHAPTYR
jgi:hypothetical protein